MSARKSYVVLQPPTTLDITAASTGSYYVENFPSDKASLYIALKSAPTGSTPTVTFTVAEADPAYGTSCGTPVSSAGLTAEGITVVSLSSITSNRLKVSWVLTGANAKFTNVGVVLISQPIAS